MPALADSLDDLTADWFTDALRDGGVLPGGGSVSEARAEIYGTGQFGFVARAELSYDGEAPDAPSSVIVKFPSQEETTRALAATIGAYEGEVRFYNEVLDRLEVRAPAAYWGQVEPESGRFTLVLEDLSSEWQVGDHIAGGTPEQAAAAFNQLVRQQAPSWNDPDLIAMEWLNSAERAAAMFAMVEPALEPFSERFRSRLDPEDLALAQRLAPHASRFPVRAWEGPLAVVHGDYRLDNLMFSDASGELEASVIDWQAVRLGPPLIDVAVHLGASFTPEQRREHEQGLLRRYHEGLLAAGVEGFSFEDCWESYRLCALYPFLLSVPMVLQLEQSDRGDELFAGMLARTGEMIRDLGSAELLE